MAGMMDIPVLGVVENYSYLKCPDCGKEIKLFGESHIDEVASELAMQVLGKMPLDPAYAELADAQADIDAIRMTKWYVQDRSSISSFSTIQSDADSIETIGTVFPILFLSVAILISLTTITRLVEEERGQIGIYKALGFSDAHVYGKYLTYTLSACICGGLLGDIGGFILMPKFLFMVFDVMYKIPILPLSVPCRLWSLRYPAVCSRSPDCSNLRMSQ